MGPSFNSPHVLLLLFLLSNGAISQERVVIDIRGDIPTGDDSAWNFYCNGYGELSTNIDCGSVNGGKVDIPPEDLNGEKGFWTSCGYCEITYNVKPGDYSFKARIYQRNLMTEVSFDGGVSWNFIQGEGWIEIDRKLETGSENEISFRFDHFTSTTFNLLEKIIVNDDTPTDPEPTTENSYKTTEGDAVITPEIPEATTDNDNINTSTVSDSSSATTDDNDNGTQPPVTAIRQERVVIDVREDIPTGDDSAWNFYCNGYGELSTYIDCGSDGGGKVDIPPEDLKDEKGFWTSCGYCEITYNVKPGDFSFKARIYQRSLKTEVSFDGGVSWAFIDGEGWVEVDRKLETGNENEISFRFDHFTSTTFNLLEKIIVNDDTPIDPEPTTENSDKTTEGDAVITPEIPEATTDSSAATDDNDNGTQPPATDDPSSIGTLVTESVTDNDLTSAATGDVTATTEGTTSTRVTSSTGKSDGNNVFNDVGILLYIFSYSMYLFVAK